MVVLIGSRVHGTSVPDRLKGCGRTSSNVWAAHAHVAQAVEHFLGKEKVPGSNPGVGSVGTFAQNAPVNPDRYALFAQDAPN